MDLLIHSLWLPPVRCHCQSIIFIDQRPISHFPFTIYHFIRCFLAPHDLRYLAHAGKYLNTGLVWTRCEVESLVLTVDSLKLQS